MRTLIFADPWDVHASSVAWGLAQAGHESTIMYTHDFPQKSAISIHLDSEQTLTGQAVALEFECARRYQPMSVEDADAVWLRRWYQPIASEDLHPADIKFSQMESSEFIRSAVQLLDERPRFWVNPLQSKLKGDRKPVQLSSARHVGLNIPKTLVSNDPQQIRQFFKRNNGQVIYKPLTGATWVAGEKNLMTYTAVINEEMLAHDAALSNAPGIYQECVEKAFELRITVIGKSVFAARLDSQKDGFYLTDWRANQLDKPIPCHVFELPEDIEQKCLAFMERMGLVFGCIDMIVKPDGEFVFLEVNEMGQFVWVEDINPEFPLLDCFVKFLISRDPDYRYDAANPICNFRQFRAWIDSQDDFEPDISRHMSIPRSYEMQESWQKPDGTNRDEGSQVALTTLPPFSSKG